MADSILIDGDLVLFEPSFGAAIVVPLPGKLSGSGPASIGGKKICVEGDEGRVKVGPCPYSAGQYSVLGTGELTIVSLAGDQKAQKSATGGKKVLLKGGKFEAKFTPQVKAQMPPPASTPDPTPQYQGKGSFVTTNVKVTGT
jgi:hypothetical protein